MNPSDVPVVTGLITIVIIAVTFAVNQFNRWQDQRDAKEKVKQDAEKAIRDAETLERNAVRIEEQIERRAAELAKFQEASAKVLALEAAAAHTELVGLVHANTALTHDAVDGAKAAYHEANSVNLKIATTNENIASLQEDLKKTISIAETAQSTASGQPMGQVAAVANLPEDVSSHPSPGAEAATVRANVNEIVGVVTTTNQIIPLAGQPARDPPPAEQP